MLVSPLASSTTPADDLHRPGAVARAGCAGTSRRRGRPPRPRRRPAAPSPPRRGSTRRRGRRRSTGWRRRAPASPRSRPPVAATSARGRAARTLASARSRGGLGLVEVEHQALADQRVERPLGPARGSARRLHDVPDQQPVVGLHQRVLVVVDADRALDPPVRRVQAVGVVRGRRTTRPALCGLADQLVVGVDPDVAARRCRGSRRRAPSRSISGSQRGTVTAIVPPGRSTRTSSAIAWMSAGMCSRTSAATTRSNSPSANGSDSASPSLTSASAPSGTSPASRIAPNRSRTPRELVGVLVEGDDVGAAAVHLERVPAGAAAHVEHPVARAQPEPVEVNGQHRCSLLLVGDVGDRRRCVRRGGGLGDGPPAEQLLRPGARPAAPIRARRSGSSSSARQRRGQLARRRPG